MFTLPDISQVIGHIFDAYRAYPHMIDELFGRISKFETSFIKISNTILVGMDLQKPHITMIETIKSLFKSIQKERFGPFKSFSTSKIEEDFEIASKLEKAVFLSVESALTGILSLLIAFDKVVSKGLAKLFVQFLACGSTPPILYQYIIELVCKDSTARDLIIKSLYDPVKNVTPEDADKIRAAYMDLRNFLADLKYFHHPMSVFISPIGNPDMRFGGISNSLDKMLNIKNTRYHAVLLAYRTIDPLNHTILDKKGEWLNAEEFIKIVSERPDKDEVWYKVGMLCAHSHCTDGIDWLIERGFVFDHRTAGCSLLKDIIVQHIDKDVIDDVIRTFGYFDEITDYTDENGKGIVHYLIEHYNETFSLYLVKFLIRNRHVSTEAHKYCTGCPVCKKRSPHKRIDLFEFVTTQRNFRILEFLESHASLMKEYKHISEEFFLKRNGISEVSLIYLDGITDEEIKRLDIVKNKPGCIVSICRFHSHEGRSCAKHSCKENNHLKMVLNKFKIKYYTVDNPIYIFVEYAKLKSLLNKEPRKVHNQEVPDKMPIVQTSGNERRKEDRKPRRHKVLEVAPTIGVADIQACGGGGGRSKPPPVREEIATKFAEIERDAVYIRLHTERTTKFYNSCSLFRTFDTPTVTKITLVEFKLHVARMLGTFYSDELAYYFYALYHYNSKTATPLERSLCNSFYSELKHRHETRVYEPIESHEEEELIILKPRKNSNEKPIKLSTSIHLKAAAHEFLFLKGLFSWYKNIVKPEEVYEDIFNDCTRLCATRFYNAMLLYNREGNESISINDSECGRLRNIMVHNSEIPQLREHIETVLFPYGEKVLYYLKTSKVEGSIIVLRECSIYSLEVQDNNALPGYVRRDTIGHMLFRLEKYVSILRSKVDHDGGSALLNCINRNWNKITDDLKIWVHHARAIESCILQIGQLSRVNPKFLRKDVQDYVMLCREVRHIGYHQNLPDSDWNFDPINPSFLADMMKGVPKTW